MAELLTKIVDTVRHNGGPLIAWMAYVAGVRMIMQVCVLDECKFRYAHHATPCIPCMSNGPPDGAQGFINVQLRTHQNR